MKIRVLLNVITVCTLLLSSSVIAQDSNSKLLLDLKQNLQQFYVNYGVNKEKQDFVSASFDSLMELLVLQEKAFASNPVTENNLDNKLKAIARYKANNAVLFDEIKTIYIYGVNNPSFRAPSSPQLDEKHIVEKYRLVWEYYLLKPETSSMSAQFDMRASSALVYINNPVSLKTIDEIYRITLSEKVQSNRMVTDKRRLLMQTVAQLPSELSYTILLRMVLDEKKNKQVVIDNDWNPELYLQQIISGKENFKGQEKWKTINSNIPANRLDRESQDLIKKLNFK